MIQLIEVAKRLRISPCSLNAKARQGVFKTAEKIKEDHITRWHISEEEGLNFIQEYESKNDK